MIVTIVASHVCIFNENESFSEVVCHGRFSSFFPLASFHHSADSETDIGTSIRRQNQIFFGGEHHWKEWDLPGTSENCVHPLLDNCFGLRHLCDPYVVILLNWTPLFGVVYGNIGVNNRHRKETCNMMRLDYVLKLYQHKENRSFTAISYKILISPPF